MVWESVSLKDLITISWENMVQEITGQRYKVTQIEGHAS